MPVLICKNIENEGPGTIEDFLEAKGISYTVLEMSGTGDMPGSSDFDTLLMMGGPMSVNEDDIYPYIKKEEMLVRDFISNGKRVLGVCLGAQIMAKALGSRVYKGAKQEIGWYDIDIADEGLKDNRILRLATHPRAGDISSKFKVFHWHGETFDIPDGAVRLASSALYPNQAFRYGADAYAFQFHIEVKKSMIYEWLRNEAIDLAKIKAETEDLYDVYTARAHSFYEVFF
ncbi:MAG: type 1 glutamine amidotransferase [Nitrospirae bacterium]|nr:type 1 glutamine amidotransferase [Nitrospirota bacterium]